MVGDVGLRGRRGLGKEKKRMRKLKEDWPVMALSKFLPNIIGYKIKEKNSDFKIYSFIHDKF